jgi:hypothetical protein
MVLSFMTRWPKDGPKNLKGKPTYFVERIWRGLDKLTTPKQQEMYFLDNGHKDCLMIRRNPDYTGIFQKPQKIHTIRLDKSDRWKPGYLIHFIIFPRTKKQFQFAPLMPVVSVQKIWITNSNGNRSIKVTDGNMGARVLGPESEKQLSRNDGFDSVEDFYSYFKEDFEGKIIHWTHYRY